MKRRGLFGICPLAVLAWPMRVAPTYRPGVIGGVLAVVVRERLAEGMVETSKFSTEREWAGYC
jgi:hypothetical protein